ncbi:MULTISPECIES: ABC transporter permease [unclassified Actinomyces]|uniref:ABC transporter permease n=1 Tax=unclassified Actinomyces TaxID=2609248 RepID=UPI0013A6AF1F|nr:MULTISPECIES: ABC transporter permease [unclassified Actinomyces]MBW3069137.1 ABC transporter permease [Actinomyces sp. 594]NDR54290.1 ABC transporter permease [Actinomyces sp. 565]
MSANIIKNNPLRALPMQQLMALAALVILYAFFAVFGNHFLSPSTFVSILDSSYYIGFLAIGMTFVIITAGIDLSSGTVMVGSALVGGVAYNVWHLPIAVALLVVLATGVAFGIGNGVLVGFLHIPPFIATLGMQFASLGLCAVIAQVQTQTYPSLTSDDGWFKTVLYKAGNLPVGIFWLAAFFVIAWFILTRTKLGRYTYAIGSNEEAVELSGVVVSRWKFWVYVLNGFFCGLAGVIYAATFSSITPQTGNGQEMYAIAACVIGGTSLAGGVGSLWGTIIGVFVISVLKTGLLSMGLPVQWQQVLIGVVVVLAVLLDVIRSRRSGRA